MGNDEDMWLLQTSSSDQTHALGERLAQCAESGLVICLQGTLGAGKTCFAQGVGQGLGVLGTVSSPTFALMVEHDAHPLPMLHADLYRLESHAALQGIGFEEEVMDWPGVVLIEWADRFVDAMPDDHLWVRIEIDGTHRTFAFSATGTCSSRVLSRLQNGQ